MSTSSIETTRRSFLATAAAGAIMPMVPGILRTAAAAPAATARADGFWSPVPLISAETRAELKSRGLPDLGGEGGQWIRDVAFGPDGQTAIWGTDVGGLYRSLDGGITWEPANIGYVPRGTNCVAFDPRDANRIIAVGANTITFDRHGIYLSTDRGASWRNTLPATYAGVFDERPAVAFDPTSDRVYWSRTAKDKASWGEGVNEPALYVSEDRGETWDELPDSEKLGGAFLAHHPTKPVLYVGGLDGFYEVREGGAKAERVSDLVVTGLDVSPAMPGRLIATTEQRVVSSTDGGRTWQDLPGTSSVVESDTTFRRVRVSPADGDRFGLYHQRPDYNWTRIVTHDGGKSFVTSSFDDSLNFLPRNVRQPQFAWHATDPDIVLASGGDWPCRSDDGGKTFRWSGGGVNNIYCATAFQFCPSNPNILALSSQDYNGGLTTDAGDTWRYVNVSGFEWGGFTYGAATANAKEIWMGLSESWGGERQLVTTRDGGETWNKTGHTWQGKGENTGIDNCLVDPEDPAIRFAGPYRSDDAGKTWSPMTGCHGVWTGAAGMLFGIEKFVKEAYALVSRDHGKSWHRLARMHAPDDFAYDEKRDRLYVTAAKTLFVLEGIAAAVAAGEQVEPVEMELPDVSAGLHTNEMKSVAVDPRRPEIVFVCRHSNVFSHPDAVLRSTDAGKTWTSITRSDALPTDRRDPAQLDGGREAMRVRVHPETGEAWITTGCYGIWKWSKA